MGRVKTVCSFFCKICHLSSNTKYDPNGSNSTSSRLESTHSSQILPTFWPYLFQHLVVAVKKTINCNLQLQIDLTAD